MKPNKTKMQQNRNEISSKTCKVITVNLVFGLKPRPQLFPLSSLTIFTLHFRIALPVPCSILHKQNPNKQKQILDVLKVNEGPGNDFQHQARAFTMADTPSKLSVCWNVWLVCVSMCMSMCVLSLSTAQSGTSCVNRWQQNTL